MKDKDQKRKEHSIPVELTPEQFDEFFLDAIPKPKRGPQGKLPPYKIFNYIMTVIYTGCQWKALPIEKDVRGVREICYSRVFKAYQKWLEEAVFHKAFGESVARLFQDGKLDISIIHGDGSTTAAKKGGDQIGYNGHKKTKGEKVVCFTDRNCNVLSPFTTAPGNASEMKLLPRALDDLKGFLKSIGMSLKGVMASFDAGYDSKANRKLVFNAGMIPNIKENPRKRKYTKRGRKRLYNPDVFEERFFTVERVFAWEDKFKRLLLRFEHISFHHFGFKLLAYTMINLRHYCQ
ncbi:IS5 family transposase [Candidatus Bealeia paramacronuclearis]|uniref:IS5 family transposase n=1 Tax=Candidatus Bealeia paramacronuclearis TaxID=1921001 RepID=A0ABZ2C2F0_9PROT|nr:IS5 family transposase [Candidatus Bealeia paramacronuclearis]